LQEVGHRLLLISSAGQFVIKNFIVHFPMAEIRAFLKTLVAEWSAGGSPACSVAEPNLAGGPPALRPDFR
jgi:hypothetical protein